MTFKKLNRRVYNNLNKWSIGTGALILLAVWAFFEASIWFVFPDFLVLILCILYPKKYKEFFIVALLFSVLGIAAYFGFVSNYPSLATNLLSHTAFVNQKMLDYVDTLYTERGVIAAITQTTTSISVKVWTFEAVSHNFNFLPYLLFVSISRAIRIFFTAIISSYIGRRFNKQLKNHFLTFLGIYTIAFFAILFYLEG